jgi:chain length determinant protein EpsF
VNFTQLVVIMRARWRVACTIFGGLVVLAVLVALVLPKKYTATSSVVVDAKIDSVVGGQQGISDTVMQSYVNTQADVVTSERVAQRVVKKLALDRDPDLKKQWLKKTGGEGDITSWLASYLLDNKRVVAAPANATATRQTNVIEISVKWPDSKMAAALANSFAETTIETNIELKVEPAKQYSAWFNQRSAALRADLERKQKRLSDFQNASGIVATDEKLDVESARLTELSTQLVAMETQRQDSQSRQRQGNGGDNEFLPEVLQSPLIANLKDNLTLAQAKQTEVAGRLGKNHPDYQAAVAEVSSLRARIAAETEKIVASLGSTTQVNIRRENDVRQALEVQKKRVMDLKHGHDEAAVLENDVVTAQRDLDAVTQRLALSNLESMTQQTNVVLLTTAAEPVVPSSPKLLTFLGVGILLGLVTGVGVVLLMEMKDMRLRKEDDLVQLLGVPVLGRIKTMVPGPRVPDSGDASGRLAPTL